MYKNLVFDVGGVLLSYDWKGAMRATGIPAADVEECALGLLDDPLWAEFDLGIRPYDDIVDEFCSKHPAYSEYIRIFLTNLDAMPLPRPEVWAEVHRLKEAGYNVYLLSNYCERMFNAHAGCRPFMNDIDGLMVSYQCHVNKPDRGIYEALLSKYSLKPSDCLFFDDRLENIEGARACGIDGIHVTGEEFLIEELKKIN